MSINASDILIRDPFVILENGKYYLYGTTDMTGHGYETYRRFSVYCSDDLKTFEGPFVIFDADKTDFWGEYNFWAPEVWKYKDKYYLIASFRSGTHSRAVDILVASSPMGPFEPFTPAPLTPENWECLDGTLYIEDNKPYLIFCHEWLQVCDGEICAVQLADDLSHPEGEPFLLFRASENTAVTDHRKGSVSKVTDGPFAQNINGRIQMIWSSFIDGRYAILEAESDSLHGTWKHSVVPIPFDGGHAMIFTDKKGDEYYAFHSPNRTPYERPVFFRKTR